MIAMDKCDVQYSMIFSAFDSRQLERIVGVSMSISDRDFNMTERYERLRNAAVGVLAVLDDPAGNPQTLHSALTVLHEAVRGESADIPPTSDCQTAPDPALHMISGLAYTGRVGRPIALDEEASSVRRQLDNDRGVDDITYNGPERNVHLTELRAMLVGGLLHELAARLRPGADFGPSREGEELAAVATGLSWTVLDQTFVGRR